MKGRRGRRKIASSDAQRRQTTVAGRRGEHERDAVTDMASRRRALMTGSSKLPDTPLGVLLGRGVITAQAYDAALYYSAIIELWQRGAGLCLGSSEGLYRAMVGGMVDEFARFVDERPQRVTVADMARREITRYDSRFAVPERAVVRRIVGGEWLGPIIDLRSSTARFYTIDVPLVLVEGEFARGKIAPLAEISRLLDRLAGIIPRPRMQKASLAA